MGAVLWIVVLPVLVLAAFFAIANRESVTISLWPVLDEIRLPLFLAMALALYLGFVLGALVAWWSGRKTRRRAHEAEKRANALAADKRDLEGQLMDLRAARATPANPAALPPS